MAKRDQGKAIGYQLSRFMRLRFLVMLGLLAGVSLCGLFVFNLMAHDQEKVAAILNNVGRQRMLSQRIALDVLRLAQGEQQHVRQDLSKAIRQRVDRLASTHRNLRYGILDEDAVAAIQALRTQPPYRLDDTVAEFRSRVDLVLARHQAGTLAPGAPEVAEVIAMATERLLPSFEVLTSAVEEGASRNVRRLQMVTLLGEAFFLLLLAFTGYGIFRPLLIRTLDAFARLSSLHKEHRELVEAMADAILSYDAATGTVSALNQAATELFGIEEDQKVALQSLIPKMPNPDTVDLTDWSRRVVRGVAAGDVPRHLEVTVREARLGRRVLVVRDISERVEAEQQVRTLLEALENGPVSVLITDLSGRIVYVNRRFCKVSGYSAEEVIGQTPRILRSGLTPPETYNELWGALTRGRQWRGELLNRRKSGELFWELISASPLLDSHGRPQRYIAVKVEITDRKRMEQDLVEARRRAESASKAKSAFLAGMSHELRTPLNAIIGFSDMMRAEIFGPLGGDKYREYIKGVHESGVHLLELINSVLDLSKIEAGRLDLHEEEVDVHDLVGATIRLVCERAHRAGVHLVTEIQPEMPPIRADALRLKQVLLNLLSNAIKFTPAGGTVTVEAATVSEGAVMLAVRDTGIGIAPDDMPRIFEPFGQGSTPMVSREQGTGLGLPLSRRLVELHRGTLTLDSEPGRGTQATVILPKERVVRRSSETAR